MRMSTLWPIHLFAHKNYYSIPILNSIEIKSTNQCVVEQTNKFQLIRARERERRRNSRNGWKKIKTIIWKYVDRGNAIDRLLNLFVALLARFAICILNSYGYTDLIFIC